MKGFLSLIMCMFVLLNTTLAQNRVAPVGFRTVSGTVTDAANSEPIVGATVRVLGTVTGTVTDLDGKYSLTAGEGVTLEFSFVGYTTQKVTVGSNTTIDVQLAEDAIQLDQVVVTALGITREQKSLPYATQQVNVDNIAKVRTDNFVNNLQGKVAGVQIYSNSGLGGSSRILIRGIGSISSENQPLFVIDGVPMDNQNFNSVDQARGGGGYDYGNAMSDINPDDIESINVLKGASATALYGSRASNGAVIVTTKKGTKRKGLGVSVNSGVSIEQISLFPKYQNQYGGGIANPDDPSGFYPIDELGGQLTPDYSTDESWGPKFEGQDYRAWNSFDAWDTKNFEKLSKWQAPTSDINEFFEKGTAFNNSIALTGGNELGNFRLSYTNVNQKGVFPNSTLKRNTVSFNGDLNVTKRFNIAVGLNYVRTDTKGRYETGYSDGILSNFNQWWQRQVNIDDLKEYKNPDGTQRTWNRGAWDDPAPLYWNNPYWSRYENYNNDNKDHYFGNITALYKFNDWLSLQGRVLQDAYNFRYNERVAVGSVQIPYYEERTIDVMERNLDVILMLNRQITNDLSLTANLGANAMRKKTQDNDMQTVGGLVVPGWYNIDNSAGAAALSDLTFEKRINSIFASASLGFKNMLYLDITGRNDWSSTLPLDNNSYFYPSVGLGWIFTELGGLKNNRTLSFGKLRLNWAKVGNDTDPYSIYDIYAFSNNFQGSPMFTLPNVKNNPDLRPEISTSYEVGLQMKFFNNRFGFDVTYYQEKAKDQIVAVATDPASGFSSAILNAGEISNKGIELQLNITPVKTPDFRWDIDVSWAKNKNNVDTLYYGLRNLRLGSIFGASVNAYINQPYGTLIGTTYTKDDNGNIVVDEEGYPIPATDGPLGTVLANWTGGITNTIRYKGLNFSFLVDAQKGGSLFSLSNTFGNYSGLFEATVFDENGNDIRQNGYVIPNSVHEDGTPNTTPTDAESYFASLFSLEQANVYDASFVKLREAKLGYTLPNNLFGKIGLRDLTLSLVGRNLWIIHKNIPNIDPEVNVSSKNVQGLEGGALLPTRTIGFNLSFSF